MLRPYRVEDANVWARMIHRNLKMPHRFVLVTDNEGDFDPLLTIVPIWPEWRDLRHPRWQDGRAHCYTRLKSFSAEFGDLLRDAVGAIESPLRFVSLDLDIAVLSDLDPLLDRPEDFVIYHRPVVAGLPERNKYQGGMWMMTAGARRQVWDDFKGTPSIEAAAQFMGTDQAWIRYKLGPNEAGWGVKDGVVKWIDVHGDNRYLYEPPERTRLIFFQGDDRPEDFVVPTSKRQPHMSHLWVERFYY